MRRFQASLSMLALFALFCPSNSEAQTFIGIESRPFPSTTLTIEQVLRGEKEGTPVTISGILRIPGPPASAEKRPAVVLLSGLGGINISHEDWSSELLRTGAAVFIVDSFSGRNLLTLPEQGRLSPLSRLPDAFAALELLSKHPRIDASRVAIMGTSHGAGPAIYSSSERFVKSGTAQGLSFAAHIGLYPNCNTIYRDETKTTGKPIRVFHGLADDWLPIGPCRQFVERLKKGNQDVALVELADAHHAYDNRFFRQVTKIAMGTSPRNCLWEEKENGQIVNAKTGHPIMNDPCFEKGAHVGYNEAAHQQTVAAVKSFLTEVFAKKR
jgi:dienelactone hydrolase